MITNDGYVITVKGEVVPKRIHYTRKEEEEIIKQIRRRVSRLKVGGALKIEAMRYTNEFRYMVLRMEIRNYPDREFKGEWHREDNYSYILWRIA